MHQHPRLKTSSTTSHAQRFPADVLRAGLGWRIDALRDARDGRPNPHVDRIGPAALPLWRRDVRTYLQALHERGEPIQGACA